MSCSGCLSATPLESGRTRVSTLLASVRGPRTELLCTHCLDDKPPPNVTESALVAHNLFPTVWEENIYEQLQFCKGDWYDKNGTETKECASHD